MPAIDFTPEQRRAIETVDRSLLVSAAAGSGKTAVLAARCAYLICDAPPPHRCDVDELLVVTFTEAAAGEMKERISRALRDRCGQSPQDARLRAQLALVDTAQVSTLHAFCLWMVRRWFDRVGVDATAQMLDADEARMLRQETLTALFDGLYGGDGNLPQRFRTLVEDYGLGYDGTIAEFTLRLAAFAASQADPDAWLAHARDTSPQRLHEVLAETQRALAIELVRQVDHCNEIAEIVAARYSAGAFYGDLVRDYATQLEAWAQRLARGDDWDDVRAEIAACRLSSKGAPRMSKDAPDEVLAERDRARDHYTEVNAKLLQKRLQAKLCRFSAAEIAADFARTAPYLETLIDLARAFEAEYAKAKRALGVMDFADLERFAHDLLTRDAGVSSTLRRRFAHVLVDEYQDINPLQAAILAAVSREVESQTGGNLFTVGDVKQSIYRFRLAEPEMFVQRANALRAGRGGACIDLQRNYRSRRAILDAVNAVFHPLMRSDCGGIAYDENAELKHPDPSADRGAPVEVHVLARDADDEFGDEGEPRFVDPSDPAQWASVEREAHLIGRRIREMMDAKTTVGEGASARPLAYGDIAILLRSTRHSAAPVANMLRQMGIPAWTEAGAGLFDSREVRDVLALLAVLDNTQQDIPLAAVLRSGILGIAFDEDELAALRAHSRDAAFHEAVHDFAERGADGPLGEKLHRVMSHIVRYRREMRARPVADVLWTIYRETGYLAQVGGWRDGEQRRGNLIALFERARQFGAFRRQGLRRFLRFVETLQAAGDELAAPAGLGDIGNAVRILSIHRAKGLEFPIVFAAELGRQFNLADASGRFLFGRKVGVGIKAVDRERLLEYPTALHRWCARSAREASLAEELRVWYVAMTRAHDRLILVGTEHEETLARLRVTGEAAGRRVGPLRILGARSPLHWLIAAQGAMPPQGSVWNDDGQATDETLFRCRTYSAEAIQSWTLSRAGEPEAQALRQAVATLKPLPAGEPVSAEPEKARAIVDRLEFVYPHLALSSIPVARAASGVGRTQAPGDAEEPAVALSMRTDIAAASRDEAVRRGQAVHAALEFVDLGGALDAAALGQTFDRLVAEGKLNSEDAALVDVTSLAWFFETELGQRVRSAGDAYRREWMFVASEPPETLDPTVIGDDTDRVLIRGVVDGVLVSDAGIEIVDYKTDRVSRGAASDRANAYATQMRLYARAVAEVFQRPVTATHLVFLHCRTIVAQRGLQP